MVNVTFSETRTPLREGLAAAAPLFGCFLKLPGPEPVECALHAGADFVVLDLEHGAQGESAALVQVALARALGLPCLVRLPAVDAGVIGRWLDAGASGVQIADVADAEAATNLVRAGRFPPEGDRGVSPTQRDGRYGARPVDDLLADGAGRPVLVAQIERELDSARLDAIARSGIDVLFVGPVDLAARIQPASQREPRVGEARAAVGAAALRAGVAFGQHALDVAAIGPEASFVTIASDVGALRAGLAGAFGAAT